MRLRGLQGLTQFLQSFGHIRRHVANRAVLKVEAILYCHVTFSVELYQWGLFNDVIYCVIGAAARMYDLSTVSTYSVRFQVRFAYLCV